jgi:nucleoside diphosphate kinase
MAMVLERANAVETLREVIGKTVPAQAADGTIRKLYGTNTNVQCNSRIGTATRMPNGNGAFSSRKGEIY